MKRVIGGKKKATGGDHVHPASHHATKLSLPTATPEEKLCADVWLFIDSKMRLALQVHRHDLGNLRLRWALTLTCFRGHGVRTQMCYPRPPLPSCTCVCHAYTHTHTHIYTYPSAGSARLSLWYCAGQLRAQGHGSSSHQVRVPTHEAPGPAQVSSKRT